MLKPHIIYLKFRSLAKSDDIGALSVWRPSVITAKSLSQFHIQLHMLKIEEGSVATDISFVV